MSPSVVIRNEEFQYWKGFNVQKMLENQRPQDLEDFWKNSRQLN